MTAKQRFMEQAAVRQKKHPKTVPKVISFSLAMAFLGLSVIFIGIAHSPGSGYTKDIINTIASILSLLTLQGAVVCSALGVTSTRYTLHCISCASLSVSLILDIGFIVYYSVWVI